MAASPGLCAADVTRPLASSAGGGRVGRLACPFRLLGGRHSGSRRHWRAARCLAATAVIFMSMRRPLAMAGKPPTCILSLSQRKEAEKQMQSLNLRWSGEYRSAPCSLKPPAENWRPSLIRFLTTCARRPRAVEGFSRVPITAGSRLMQNAWPSWSTISCDFPGDPSRAAHHDRQDAEIPHRLRWLWTVNLPLKSDSKFL
jgi:hypothetical protein